MTAVDFGIVAFVAIFALAGLRAGFVVGSVTLVALAVGAIAGAKLGPALLAEGSKSPYAPLSALGGGLLIGAAVAIFVEDIAASMREKLVTGQMIRRSDAAAGTLLMAVVGLAIAWLAGVMALNTPGLDDLRQTVQRSHILSNFYEEFPPSDSLINVLNKVDPTPGLKGEDVRVDPPPRRIVKDPDVQAAAASVVRVRGNACGLGVAGSGWVASPALIVTNAHVVAGQTDTVVVTQDGNELSAAAVTYLPKKDLAVLRVDGLDLPALDLAASPEAGDPAAILGFPEDGPFEVSPARLGKTSKILAPDSYGSAPIERRVSTLRGRVISGNSGGPVVSARGRVVGTIFAAALGTQRPQGFAIPNRPVRNALSSASEEVDTGPCT